MSQGRLFCISGPSGAGKGTLVERVLGLVPDAWVSVSATTRKPRVGEVDGVHYFFMTEQEFTETIDEDGFIEWARVHSNFYGTPIAPICEHVAAGDCVLLEIDVQGAFQVRDKIPETTLVFIAPPSMEELEARLRGRGTDAPEVIDQRLQNAQAEIDASHDYDYVIVNDDLDRATAELVSVLQS